MSLIWSHVLEFLRLLSASTAAVEIMTNFGQLPLFEVRNFAEISRIHIFSGLVVANLKVEILKEGSHSGHARYSFLRYLRFMRM